MILYHGTRARFARFTAQSHGRGAEANSVLGIWATRCPHAASAYGGDRRLLVLDVPVPRLAIVCCYDTALRGGPDLSPADREIGIARLKSARAALRARGIGGVWCELPGTDLAGAVCLLEPAAIAIRETIEHPECRDLEALEDPADDSAVDFSLRLEDLLATAPA